MADSVGVFHCGNPGNPNSFATSESGLPVDGKVEINGTTDLYNIIKFYCLWGCGWVSSIVLRRSSGIYDYVLEVYGKADPQGCGYLRFWDKTGDYYTLSICKCIEDTHTVRYNSDNPVITKIEWSDCPF